MRFVPNNDIMRSLLQPVLKRELRILALQTRSKHELTQREMAEPLSLGVRSYSLIETGVTSCGALTAILLILSQDDPLKFLDHLKGEIIAVMSDSKIKK